MRGWVWCNEENDDLKRGTIQTSKTNVYVFCVVLLCSLCVVGSVHGFMAQNRIAQSQTFKSLMGRYLMWWCDVGGNINKRCARIQNDTRRGGGPQFHSDTTKNKKKKRKQQQWSRMLNGVIFTSYFILFILFFLLI